MNISLRLFYSNAPGYALFACILMASLSIGCNADDPWKAEYTVLSDRSEKWHERFDSLNARIDSLWDVTSAELEAKIPPDFPEIDRDIFIHARNADHITMFMSFHQLDTALQAMVYDAGRKDALLAAQMRQLNLDKNAIDKDISIFLQQVAASDPDASRRMSDALHHAQEAQLQ